ncbi:MAG: ATP-binding protein [Bacillota bacterium]
MEKNNNYYLVISISVALASQISISLFDSSFRISGGVIAFFILLYFFDTIDPLKAGIYVGVAVFIFRVLIFSFESGSFSTAIFHYLASILFYFVYSFLFIFKLKKISINKKFKFFFMIILADLTANFTEILFRNLLSLINIDLNLLLAILIAAIIRSVIILLILNLLKYYKIIFIRKEKLDRYRELMILSSKLKSELYWLQKNKNYLENIMSSAYNLYDNIENNKNKSNWAINSLNIAKNIHEVKKDYNLVLEELENITQEKTNKHDLYLSELIDILINSYNHKNCKINFISEINKDFIVKKDYYLMSILRNILNNALESLDKEKDKIKFKYFNDNNKHVFEISDNGKGIEEDNLDLIFSAGFSTKIDYETGEINRGLGLSIAKDIINNIYEGEIKVESKVNKGSTFQIEIPEKKLEV